MIFYLLFLAQISLVNETKKIYDGKVQFATWSRTFGKLPIIQEKHASKTIVTHLRWREKHFYGWKSVAPKTAVVNDYDVVFVANTSRKSSCFILRLVHGVHTNESCKILLQWHLYLLARSAWITELQLWRLLSASGTDRSLTDRYNFSRDLTQVDRELVAYFWNKK